MGRDMLPSRRRFSRAALFRALRQPTFLIGVVIAVGLWGFAELADAIDEQHTTAFDRAVLESLRVAGRPEQLIGPPWVDDVLRDVTALGSVTILSGVTLVVCGFLWLSGRHGLGAFTLLATASGGILTFLLKDLFDRPRPDLVPPILIEVTSASFPSGHAMASAVVFLTLGAILTEFLPTWRLKAYVMSVAILLTFVVGTTRVFLGAHWPTDVLAGWAAGFAWAYGCRSAVRLGRFLWGYRRASTNRLAEAAIDAPLPPTAPNSKPETTRRATGTVPGTPPMPRM